MNESEMISKLQRVRAEAIQLTKSLDGLAKQAESDLATKLIADAQTLFGHWKGRPSDWLKLKRDLAAPTPGPKFKQESEALVRSVNQALEAMRRLIKSTRTSVACPSNAGNLASALDVLAGLPKILESFITKAKEMEASRQAAFKKQEEQKKKPEVRQRPPGKPKTVDFTCYIDCRSLRGKYPKIFDNEAHSAKVKFTFKTPVERAPQLGRITLGDAFIACPSGQQTIGYKEGKEGIGGPVKRGDVHNHFVLHNIEGAGVYIVRDMFKKDVAKVSCTMWDLGRPFGAKIAEILQTYTIK
jgi:hypothetical protein